MRALETARPMLRATNTGVTAIIDDRGHVTGQLPTFAEGVLQGSVQARAGTTPYVRVGNLIALIACAVLLFAALATLPRGTASRN